MRAWYIREQRHILGTSDYAEVDLFETTDKEHTASTRRKRELATSISASWPIRISGKATGRSRLHTTTATSQHPEILTK